MISIDSKSQNKNFRRFFPDRFYEADLYLRMISEIEGKHS